MRVWFRGKSSTPDNDEIWAKADIFAIDSIVPWNREEPRAVRRGVEAALLQEGNGCSIDGLCCVNQRGPCSVM